MEGDRPAAADLLRPSAEEAWPDVRTSGALCHATSPKEAGSLPAPRSAPCRASSWDATRRAPPRQIRWACRWF